MPLVVDRNTNSNNYTNNIVGGIGTESGTGSGKVIAITVAIVVMVKITGNGGRVRGHHPLDSIENHLLRKIVRVFLRII